MKRDSFFRALQFGFFKTPSGWCAAAEATAFYALGFVGYSGVKILLPAYYARRNAIKPLYTSLAAIGVNAGLNLLAFLMVEDSRIRFWGLALVS